MLFTVESEAAIGVAQPDQRRAQAEEREDAQQALQARHVDQEDLGDHDADQRHAGVPQRRRVAQEAQRQQGDAEQQPDRRVGVELQAVGAEPAPLEARIEEMADLERDVGEGQDRGGGLGEQRHVAVRLDVDPAPRQRRHHRRQRRRPGTGRWRSAGGRHRPCRRSGWRAGPARPAPAPRPARRSRATPTGPRHRGACAPARARPARRRPTPGHRTRAP